MPVYSLAQTEYDSLSTAVRVSTHRITEKFRQGASRPLVDFISDMAALAGRPTSPQEGSFLEAIIPCSCHDCRYLHRLYITSVYHRSISNLAYDRCSGSDSHSEDSGAFISTPYTHAYLDSNKVVHCNATADHYSDSSANDHTDAYCYSNP